MKNMLDWLPFEFLEYDFMKYALLAILIIGCIDHCFVLPYLATLIA